MMEVTNEDFKYYLQKEILLFDKHKLKSLK